ncbi:MAG: NMD3-related protein [Candidatus Nanoarchaeia archaeon]
MGIKAKFCIICGTESDILIGSKCFDCYFKTAEIKFPKKIVLFACPYCDSIFYKGFWQKSTKSHEEYLIDLILEKTKLPANIKLENVQILQVGKEGVVEFSYSVGNKRFFLTKKIELYITDKVCPVDSAARRQSYEGVMQIRGKKENLLKIQELLKDFKNAILKIENIKNGFDVYFLRIENLNSMVNVLKKKRFAFKVKKSVTAYSWDKSKNRPKYKITMLINLV